MVDTYTDTISFSKQVKEELCVQIPEAISDVELYQSYWLGLLIGSKSEHNYCKSLLLTEYMLCAELFHDAASIFGMLKTSSLKTVSGKKFSVSLEFEQPPQLLSLPTGNQILNHDMARALLVGIFLSCGSITNPLREYHLEFAFHNDTYLTTLEHILIHFLNVSLKYTYRKNVHLAYIKESEQIEDVLTFMGAIHSSLEIMNVKILKDVRNRANRVTNCDSANIEKIVNASARQIEDILLIDREKGLSSLPPELRQLAQLRLDNPELSLRELGLILDKPLGRSGVNHRLQRISQVAKRLAES